MRRWRLGPLLTLAAIFLGLVGARFVAYPAFIGSPDHVHIAVTRVQFLSGPVRKGEVAPYLRQVIFDRHIGTAARPLYSQLVALRSIPEGAVMSCPTQSTFAPYYHYDLTFSRAGITTGVVTSDAIDCQVLDLTSPDGSRAEYSWYVPNGVSFWDTLHQLAGAPLPI